MTDQPATADGAEKETFWASFTRADLRLLVVTFAGTLVANVVTVLLVAVAVLAARPAKPSPPTVGSVLGLVALVAFGIICVVVWTVSVRHNPHPNDRYSRVFMRVMAGVVVALALGTLVFLLILVGLAVGVK